MDDFCFCLARCWVDMKESKVAAHLFGISFRARMISSFGNISLVLLIKIVDRITTVLILVSKSIIRIILIRDNLLNCDNLSLF